MIYLVSNNPELPGFNGVATASFEEAISFLSTLDVIGFDTETEGGFNHSNRILLLQLGNYHHQYVFDFQTLSLEERKELEDKIFWDKSKIKIAHNAVFDIQFLWRHNIKSRAFYDTLIAEKLLNAGIQREKGYYSLYATANRYLSIELDKSVRGLINKKGYLTTSIIKYAAEDVQHLEELRRLQLSRLRKYRLVEEDCQDIYTTCGLEMRNLHVFASYTYNGARIDLTKLKEADATVLANLQEVDSNITAYIHNEPRLKAFAVKYQDLFTPLEDRVQLNLNSPVQKLKALRMLYAASDVPDTSERTLLKLRAKKGGEFIKLLLEHNKLNKLRTAFTNKLHTYINPITGKIHPSYNQVLDTGRVSSSNPNIQQIPARSEIGGVIRKCFVPSKGYKMVGGDFSGAELRVIAEFSKDPVWVSAFLNGEDLHSKLCTLTFNIPLEDVKKYTPFKQSLTYREVQKTLNFGLAYGMSYHKLADTLEISESQAEGIIDTFFSRVPYVEQFLEKNAAFGRKYGFITTPPPYRRRRWFEGYNNTSDYALLASIERKSKNTPIQGCNADFTKLAQIYIYEYILEHNLPVNMLFPVHDEIQTECAAEYAPAWASKMSQLMSEASNVVLKTVPMIVDCKVSDHWSK